MSENAITLVELDVSSDTSVVRGPQIMQWLLDEGVVIRNPTRSLHLPSSLGPGPNAVKAAPEASQFLDLSNNGVDVITERDIHLPVENYEPPPCPACGTPIDSDVHYGLVEEWMAGTEPNVTCDNCGETNRIGDWVHVFTFYVGNLAVRFNNWSPLTEMFIADLGSRLGSRWRLVLQHS